MIDSLSNDYVLSANKTYKSTSKLKENILGTTDQEIYDRLLSGVVEEDDKDEPSLSKPDTEKAETTYTSDNILKDSLIQVYNYETGEYELYNTKELLNSKQEEVTTTEHKIKEDAFLYNYFYGNKVNQFFQKSKVFIMIAFIIVIIINLIMVSKHLSKKEAKTA